MKLAKRTKSGLLLLFLAFSVNCGAPVEEPQEATQAAMTATASPSPAPARASGPRRRPVSRLAASPGRGRLKLAYAAATTEERQALQQVLREERLFEDVLDDLNAGLVLPHDVHIRLQECGEVNAFYDPNAKSMLLCYELFDHFMNMFSQGQGDSEEEQDLAATKAVAALVFVFYHELGHALVDVYDLPITGREEDAVDQLATVLLLETWEGEDSEMAILSSAEWFELDANEGGEDVNMAGEHSLDEQRYYNLVCWIYGSDPDYFGDVADDWGLPPARAQRCSSEYARMSNAWGTILGPHMRPAGP